MLLCSDPSLTFSEAEAWYPIGTAQNKRLKPSCFLSASPIPFLSRRVTFFWRLYPLVALGFCGVIASFVCFLCRDDSLEISAIYPAKSRFRRDSVRLLGHLVPNVDASKPTRLRKFVLALKAVLDFRCNLSLFESS